MHRHYGMPLGHVGHSHNGADGPTHGPHTHSATGLGDVVTLEAQFGELRYALQEVADQPMFEALDARTVALVRVALRKDSEHAETNKREDTPAQAAAD